MFSAWPSLSSGCSLFTLLGQGFFELSQPSELHPCLGSAWNSLWLCPDTSAFPCPALLPSSLCFLSLFTACRFQPRTLGFKLLPLFSYLQLPQITSLPAPCNCHGDFSAFTLDSACPRCAAEARAVQRQRAVWRGPGELSLLATPSPPVWQGLGCGLNEKWHLDGFVVPPAFCLQQRHYQKVTSRTEIWASLVARWRRIHQQETLVQSLIPEDPTFLGATEPRAA